MSNQMQLRNYQQEIVDNTLAIEDDVIISLPTGGGKSICIKEIAEHYSRQGKKVAVSVRASILIPQLKSTLELDGLSVGVVKAGYEYISGCDVVLIMEQTYKARHEQLNISCDVLIRDEAHIGWFGDDFALLKNNLEPTRVIGLSATPITEQGACLDLDTKIVDVADTGELINQGYLSNIEYIVPRRSELMDYSKVATSANDYNSKQLDFVLNTLEHNKFIAEQINKYCSGRKIAVFANSIEHVEALSQVLADEGIPNTFIHSKQSKKESEANLEQYKNGTVNCIVNMSILTTGFDDPATDCIVLVRPTKILRLYLQIVGRGLRILQGKGNCLLLDLAKCVSTHGFVEGKRKFNLETKEDIFAEQEEQQLDELADMDERVTKDKVIEYRLNKKQERIDSLLMDNELLVTKVKQITNYSEATDVELNDANKQIESLKQNERANGAAMQVNAGVDNRPILQFIIEFADINSKVIIDYQFTGIELFYLLEQLQTTTCPYIIKSCVTRVENLINQKQPLTSLVNFIKYVESSYVNSTNKTALFQN